MVDRALTIVQMLPDLEVGGVERGTLELGKYLVQHGHRSIVISNGGRLVSQLESEGSEHVLWDVGIKSPLTLQYVSRLRKFLTQQKVDILHLRSRMPAWIGYLAWKSLPRNSRPRLVTTFHGFYSVNSYSAIMTKGEKVIAISEVIKEHLKNIYKIPENAIAVIREGIDLEYFDPQRISHERIQKLKDAWELSKDDEAVLMLPSRITKWKGHEIFLKSLASIRDLKWKAVCVGNPAEKPLYYNSLLKLIESLHLHDQVKFVGQCDDMPAAYLLADIVISASSAEAEAFGRVAVEAQAMGKPVIATAHGGSLETVLPGKTGWLVKPNDSQSLADAIRKGLNNRQQLQDFGENAIKWAHENFSTVRMCEETVSLYNDLLKQKEGITWSEKQLLKTDHTGYFKKTGEKSLKVVHILPELDEGGVERHVLMLSAQQKEKGQEVIVVSAGGKLVSQLVKGVLHVHLPVHRKNPLVGIYCAVRLVSLVRRDKIDIIHAHSRVPAWIALLTSKFSGIPYIVTAHAYFSNQAKWIYIPYRQANTTICVSKSVQNGMRDCFADNTVVIRNGMPAVRTSWKGSGASKVSFLFVGRLTQLKGLQDIFKIAPSIKDNWKLDVLGDGPLRGQLEEMVRSLKLEEKVFFHGFQDDPDAWMERSDCLLFPSYIEGMPLTLARAIQIGIPVIASDIEPVSEMALEKNGLVKPGDLEAWKNGIERFLVTRQSPASFDKNAIPTLYQMTQEVQSVYESATSRQDISQ